MTRSAQHIAYRFGSFVLDLEQEALLAADGTELPLRPKSFALLRLLIENAGRLLSQDRIMEALWPNVCVTENSVTQCIHDIRSALGSAACRTIQTRPRRGYLFIADVTAVPAPVPSLHAGGPFVQPGAADYREEETQILAARSLESSPSSHSDSRGAGLPDVVAPSRNLDVLKHHLMAGLPEDIFTDLALYLVNIVVASSDALRRNRHRSSLQDVAREAGMSHVIQGSIQGIVGRLADFDLGVRSAR